ncbi:hypothetical protein COCNU_11G001370 [Cocos nucifera]|uniref:RecF/RecN/SMC N-terminal domain-containing protein n=1 Tax=Cocos nucifera TaxID=13894 RepID=A0A8K0INH6_COCNU|nr:hypothetical protein COCNU_11G001370 [Cocos nucifera]
MDDIVGKIKQKNTHIAEVQTMIEKNRLEASEARKLEQECIKKQELLIPLEQAARQKVTEFMSILESERSQGPVLKAILHAKETKEIEGIYGRLGDLGAIDAEMHMKQNDLSKLFHWLTDLDANIGDLDAQTKECIKKQELLIPLEQAARQKVTEFMSILESERSQGPVLKAILHAKETKEIEGIYGRLGDLGAIDAEMHMKQNDLSKLFHWLTDLDANIGDLDAQTKTLSSLALVFALHHCKPTPLYVMDEIDAALDFKNVSIVGHHVKERTRDAQFIIISLRNNTLELADDRLVGIYKTDNCTKSIAINPGSFVDGGGAA